MKMDKLFYSAGILILVVTISIIAQIEQNPCYNWAICPGENKEKFIDELIAHAESIPQFLSANIEYKDDISKELGKKYGLESLDLSEAVIGGFILKNGVLTNGYKGVIIDLKSVSAITIKLTSDGCAIIDKEKYCGAGSMIIGDKNSATILFNAETGSSITAEDGTAYNVVGTVTINQDSMWSGRITKIDGWEFVKNIDFEFNLKTKELFVKSNFVIKNIDKNNLEISKLLVKEDVTMDFRNYKEGPIVENNDKKRLIVYDKSEDKFVIKTEDGTVLNEIKLKEIWHSVQALTETTQFATAEGYIINEEGVFDCRLPTVTGAAVAVTGKASSPCTQVGKIMELTAVSGEIIKYLFVKALIGGLPRTFKIPLKAWEEYQEKLKDAESEVMNKELGKRKEIPCIPCNEKKLDYTKPDGTKVYYPAYFKQTIRFPDGNYPVTDPKSGKTFYITKIGEDDKRNPIFGYKGQEITFDKEGNYYYKNGEQFLPDEIIQDSVENELAKIDDSFKKQLPALNSEMTEIIDKARQEENKITIAQQKEKIEEKADGEQEIAPEREPGEIEWKQPIRASGIEEPVETIFSNAVVRNKEYELVSGLIVLITRGEGEVVKLFTDVDRNKLIFKVSQDPYSIETSVFQGIEANLKLKGENIDIILDQDGKQVENLEIHAWKLGEKASIKADEFYYDYKREVYTNCLDCDYDKRKNLKKDDPELKKVRIRVYPVANPEHWDGGEYTECPQCSYLFRDDNNMNHRPNQIKKTLAFLGKT